MTHEEILVFILVSAPIVVLGYFFYRTWEKNFFLPTFFGFLAGILATFPVKWVIYPLLSLLLPGDLRNIISTSSSNSVKALGCFGIIGPIEETVKFVFLLGVILYSRLEKRPRAIVLASISTGFGFAFVENLDYYRVFGSEVLAIRSFVTTAGHVLFGGVLGVTLAKALPDAFEAISRRVFRGLGIMILGLLSVFFLHGLFNFIAFSLSPANSLKVFIVSLIFGIFLLFESWKFILILESERNILNPKIKETLAVKP